MFDLVNTWQFNLVGYYISVVIFFQFYKVAVKQAKDDGAATILLQVLGGISMLVCIPFFPFTFTTDFFVYLLLTAVCVFYDISDRLQTTARKHLQVSIISILAQLTSVFMLIYGFTFFHNPLVPVKILAAVLILAGNIILLFRRGHLELNKYIFFIILASFALATAMSIDINISKHFNLPFYIAFTFLVPGLFIFLAERIPVKDIITESRSKALKYYIITAFAWGFSIIFSLRAFQLGQVTTIVPLQACAVLLNVLVASVFLKEKENIDKKIIAAILVIIGVYFTVMK
jgi:drug/metabolite transporter (DMT)-like permease